MTTDQYSKIDAPIIDPQSREVAEDAAPNKQTKTTPHWSPDAIKQLAQSVSDEVGGVFNRKQYSFGDEKPKANILPKPKGFELA